MASPTRSSQICLKKEESRTRTSGAEFEYKLAGLTFLRARKQPGLHFLLATNVHGAKPMDDVFIRLKWTEGGEKKKVAYFVQLKHAEKTDSKFKYDSMKTESGDFSLKKYFKFYKHLIDQIEQVKLKKQPTRQERILYGCDIKDCRFIIYTTKAITGYANTVNNLSHDVDFPFSHLFLTSDKEHVHVCTDQTLGDLVDIDDRDLFLTGFLPRVQIFTCQAQADSQMTDILQMELNQLFGLPLSRAPHYLPKLLDFLHQWWKCDKMTPCLSESSDEIEQMLKEDANTMTHECYKTDEISFNNTVCQRLNEKLSSKRIFLMSVPCVSTNIRTAKIMQVLNSYFSNSFLFLNDKTILHFPLKALASICRKLCKIVLLDFDVLTSEIARFLEDIISKDLCQVVVMSKSYNTELVSLLESFRADYDRITDQWTLEQLSDEKQEELIEYQVKFQGRKMELKRLKEQWPSMCKTVDASVLNALFCKQLVEFGAPLPIAEDVYISRTFHHKTTLHPDVLFLQEETDLLVLSGFSEHQLDNLPTTKMDSSNIGRMKDDSTSGNSFDVEQKMQNVLMNINVRSADYYADSSYPDNCSQKRLTIAPSTSSACEIPLNNNYQSSKKADRQSKSSFWVSLSQSKTGKVESTEENEKNFEALCATHAGRNIHWIENENNVLVWRKSYGLSDQLDPFIIKKDNNCKLTHICTHNQTDIDFSSWKEQIILLTGEPGIGKSKFLLRVAEYLNRKKMDFWTIFIEINSHRKFMNTLNLDGTISKRQIVDLLSEAADVTNIYNTATKKCIEESLDAGKVIVLVDGIDEVCPSYKERALSILQSFIQHNITQLWVTAREEIEKDLSQFLHTIPLKLNPFSEDEQIKYLECVWENSIENADKEHLKRLVRNLVQDLKEKTETTGRSICDLPLYTHLIAATCEQQIRDSLEGEHSSLQNYKIKILKLFRDFVHQNRKRYNEHFGVAGAHYEDPNYLQIEEETFNEIHMKCAMISLFADEKTDLPMQEFEKEVNQAKIDFQVQRTGIMRILSESGKPVFIHRSFAEYFAALWLKQNYKGYRSFLKDYFSSTRDGMVAFFFDQMLAESHALHEAVLDDKESEVRFLLEKYTDVNDRDAGERTALHLAAIHGREAPTAVLLQHGAQVDVEDKVLGWTPLLYADFFSRLDVIEHLLSHDADPKQLVNTVIRAHQKNILSEAASKGYNKLARFLHQNSVRDDISLDGLHPAHLAAYKGHAEVVKMFLDEEIKWDLRQRHGRTMLHDSCQEGHGEVVNLLLSRGADPNVRDYIGVTPIMLAAAGGHVDIAEKLLDSGANVKKEDDDGRTPLHFATQCSKEMVQFLLSRGADIHARDKNGVSPVLLSGVSNKDILLALVEAGADMDSKDKNRRSVMHIAVSYGNKDIVQYLLDVGMDPNELSDKNNVTPLHVAILSSHKDIFDILLKNGAKWDVVQTNNGRTALHDAAQEGLIDIVRILGDLGADTNVEDNTKITPLMLAVSNGHINVAKYLLENGSSCNHSSHEGQTILHHAVMGGNMEIVQMLLDVGSNPNVFDCNGITPLQIAAVRGDVELFKMILVRTDENEMRDVTNGRSVLHLACLGGKLDIVQYLLERGENPNVIDASGNTPMLLAIAEGSEEIFNLLLQYGADVTMSDSDSRSALHYAAQFGKERIVERLYELGLDPDAQDVTGMKPLHLAAHSGHKEIVLRLLEWKCAPDAQTNDGKTPLHVAARRGHLEIAAALLARTTPSRDNKGILPIHEAACEGHSQIITILHFAHGDVNSQDDDGTTPLVLATVFNHPQCVTTLIGLGANVNLAAEGNRTALHIAAAKSNASIVKLLLENGADVTLKDSTGRTPFHVAAAEDNTEIVEEMIHAGADVNAADNTGLTPFMLASYCGCIKVMELLANRGARPHAKLSSGRNALHLVAQTAYVSVAAALLDMGLPINGPDNDGLIPVFFVESLPMLRLLIEHGANWQATCPSGRSVLHYATQDGSLDIIDHLLALGMYVDLPDVSGVTALELAAEGGHADVIKFFVQQGASVNWKQNNGRSALHQATQKGFDQVVQLLLDVGADPNIKDNDDIRPLHLAALLGNRKCVEILLANGALPLFVDKTGRSPVFIAIMEGHVEIAERLLDAGDGDVNIVDYQGTTLLHAAAHSGSMAAVQMLLERGAVWDAPGAWGRSVLHEAVFGSNVAVVVCLLSLGADPNQPDEDGVTPVLLAVAKGFQEGVNALTAAGGRVADNNGLAGTALAVAAKQGVLSPQMLQLLLESGCNPDDKYEGTLTALHIAANNGQENVVQALVQSGADCGAVDSENLSTPLHRAAHKGNPTIALMLLHTLDAEGRAAHAVAACDRLGRTPLHLAAHQGDEQVVRLLLEYGSPLEAKDTLQLVPLHLAAKEGHMAAARALLEAGASPTTEDALHHTPLALAAAMGHAEMVRLLMNPVALVQARPEVEGQEASGENTKLEDDKRRKFEQQKGKENENERDGQKREDEEGKTKENNRNKNDERKKHKNAKENESDEEYFTADEEE